MDWLKVQYSETIGEREVFSDFNKNEMINVDRVYDDLHHRREALQNRHTGLLFCHHLSDENQGCTFGVAKLVLFKLCGLVVLLICILILLMRFLRVFRHIINYFKLVSCLDGVVVREHLEILYLNK